MKPYTWEIVIGRIKARREARAEAGLDVSNLDSVLVKMGRRDPRWPDGYANYDGGMARRLSGAVMDEALNLVVATEKLHALYPSLKGRMLADEAARLCERLNAWIESESSTPSS